ncbi:ABC transporter ATP-binding protein [Vagococcus coleopterorum]|uniref:ABC transporter ATP-binding protein n=1 Tax=Vagococcus coleopterorum TaxID=2714946 RepID=A0A6G8ANN0_9ENTE|nr:ABC transporter ATP-binding protein [Vagococcus coleopterorum]QIL46535.1 ABC transporter ATP-binding protein [Vagococcus coleopterorum]
MSNLEVKQIQKKFGKKEVLKDVSFTLEPGHIYGLLGRNGAGKSTLLSIINNRVIAKSGDVLLGGESVFENDQLLRQLFLVNDSCLSAKDENQKIKYYLETAETFYPDFDREQAEHLMSAFGLKGKQKLRKLSTGYRSIFNIVLALSMNIPYIFLDEPILGLDANHRDLFYKEMLDVFSKGNTSFIISTHLIEEVSHIIDSVIVLNNGTIEIEDSVEDIINKAWTVTGSEEEIIAVKNDLNVVGWERLGNQVTLYIYGEQPVVSDSLTVGKTTLQKIFIQLTATEVA